MHAIIQIFKVFRQLIFKSKYQMLTCPSKLLNLGFF